jgi:hypothetical protein
MNAKLALAGMLVLGYVLPAAAADSYYIVRDPDAKKCEIVSQKPVGTKVTVVNPDGSTYTTRTDAETAMKTVKVCTETK